MKPGIRLLILAMAAIPPRLVALPEVELIPEQRMGARNHVRSKDIRWDCTLDEWGKPIEVCRRIPRKHPIDAIVSLAREAGMTEQKTWPEIGGGIPGDGTIVYRGRPGSKALAMINPNRDSLFFGLRPLTDFNRDADSFPILQGLPAKEDAVGICRDWMKKIQIDEAELARRPEGVAGFDVQFTSERETGWNKKLQREISHEVSLSLTFYQKIGAYPAYRSGNGGTIQFNLADGGELASIRYSMHGWEPMGSYEILSRDEITSAIKEGFCWTNHPIDAPAIRIDAIYIEAYHDLPEAPQQTFPLIYRLVVRSADEPKTADYDTIFLPALKQHRDKYPLASKK